MEWLLYLACPLMMLFCMKGMFSGNKDSCEKGKKQGGSEVTNNLQQQMNQLVEQNNMLIKEINELKGKEESKSGESMNKKSIG